MYSIPYCSGKILGVKEVLAQLHILYCVHGYNQTIYCIPDILLSPFALYF